MYMSNIAISSDDLAIQYKDHMIYTYSHGLT